jgi:hypothetical protein
LQQRDPLPLNQGMRGWFWTGHRVFSDDSSPASLLYAHRVLRRNDFDFTLNQAEVYLEAEPAEGSLRLHLDTECPSFEQFRIDKGQREAVELKSGDRVTLDPDRPGRATWKIWPRNAAGRDGIPTELFIDR